MDHTDELEELCQAANHLNESGGESGGELWLQHAGTEEIVKPEPEVLVKPESNNSPAKEKAKNVSSDESVTDLVVI